MFIVKREEQRKKRKRTEKRKNGKCGFSFHLMIS